MTRKSMAAAVGGGGVSLSTPPTPNTPPPPDDTPQELSLDMNIEQFENDAPLTWIDRCDSILVCTGVYGSGTASPRSGSSQSSSTGPGAGVVGVAAQAHRDFVMDVSLCQPSMTTVHNVEEAVRAIYEKEGINHMLLRR